MSAARLFAVCFLAMSVLLAGLADAGIIDPCQSIAILVLTTAPGPSVCLAACPQGDAASFIDQGWYISLTILDGAGGPIPGIPATDVWIVDCDMANNEILLCGSSQSSGADSLTNSLGQTTMSRTSLAASRCGAYNGSDDRIVVVVQGEILLDPATECSTPRCLEVGVRSCDLSGDGIVNLIDLTGLAEGFPPNPYDPCADYDCSGTNDLVDVSEFAIHFGPPRHSCQ